MLKTLALSTALLATPLYATVPATTASAPTVPSSKLTPNQQQAQLRRQNARLTKAALQVAHLIDAGKAGEVWDGGSAVMQQATSRATFTAAVTTDRTTTGALVERKLLTIVRRASDGHKLPPGDYANIDFATTFADRPQPVRELISFHLDPGRVWRVASYTLR